MLVAWGLCATVAGTALADPAGPAAWVDTAVSPASSQAAAEKDEEEKKDKPGQMLGVPIPIADPTIGWGLGAAALYLRKLDKDDETIRPSTFGLGAFYTSSDSWGVGLGARMYIQKDRYRPLGGLGMAQLNYDFYGIGDDAGNDNRSILIEQRVEFALFEFLFRVRKHLYIGPRYRWLNSDTVIDLSGLLPGDPSPPRPEELDATTANVGLHVQWDSRDNDFSATKGTNIDLVASLFREAVGSDFDFEAYRFDFNRYISIGGNDHLIIAPRATLCDVTDGAPFYEICSIGLGDAIRGYPGGQYRDHTSITAQAEFRWQMVGRFGMVFFAGGGAVAPNFGDYSNSSFLPSVGLGVRYMVVPANRVNVRVDFAWGRDSNALYISVGEAF